MLYDTSDFAYVKRGYLIAISGWPAISEVSGGIAEWSLPTSS